MNSLGVKILVLVFGAIIIAIIVFMKDIKAWFDSGNKKKTEPDAPVAEQVKLSIEDRLIRLHLDEIRYRYGVWNLYGPYTAPFTGKTILEAIEDAEKQTGTK